MYAKYLNQTKTSLIFLIELMCRNAQTFNESGSEIYKDAKVILKTVKQIHYQILAAKKAQENRGTPTRSRKLVTTRYASEIASIPYDDR